ncbi:MAG TPA: hypothetical protein VMJ73_00110 [Rhizomicrobium sp.]|nr:hypothetical protein [Rhizomicrobium sp.]
MTADAQSARDDLAFLKSLLGEDEYSGTRSFGEAYFAAGLIYGGQMILHALQAAGFLPGSGVYALLIGIGPTILFIPVMAWIIWRNRSKRPAGVVGRSIGAVFGTIGIANLFLIVVIGSVAWREQSVSTWLIYPCCVFVLQGTAWLFSFMMRKHGWHLAVALGWFATAVAMAVCVAASPLFILFAGIGLWFCMALPGWIVLRNAKGSA